MSQRNIRITPERYFQKLCGISIKIVEAFKTTVNRIIDTASESITRYGYHFCFSPSEPARTTGRTGRTHGASMVKIPAKNEARRSVIKRRD
jgi:hypothetical protein